MEDPAVAPWAVATAAGAEAFGRRAAATTDAARAARWMAVDEAVQPGVRRVIPTTPATVGGRTVDGAANEVDDDPPIARSTAAALDGVLGRRDEGAAVAAGA